MENSTKKISFDWEETGKLDIQIEGNHLAIMRYEPSPIAVAETLAKFSKTTGNQEGGAKHTNTPCENKGAEKQLKTKKTGNDEVYRYLSIESHEALKNGRLDDYADKLEHMAELLDNESSYIDELKLLMLAFYIRVNLPNKRPSLNTQALVKAKAAFHKSGITEEEMQKLYFETVDERVTPIMRMTVKGSYRLFSLCIRSLWDRATLVLAQLEE